MYSKIRESNEKHENKYFFSKSITFSEILALTDEYSRRHHLLVPESFHDILPIIEQGNYERIQGKNTQIRPSYQT